MRVKDLIQKKYFRIGMHRRWPVHLCIILYLSVFASFVSMFGFAGAVGLRLIGAVAEHDRRTDEGVFFADFAFKEAFPRPVKQTKIAAVNDEPWRADVGLDNILRLRASIFQASRRVFDDGFGEDFIEVGSFNFLVASGVDLGGEFEEFGNVMAGFGTGDEDGGVRNEVEILFEFVENSVGVVDKVGLSQNDDDSLAGFDDLAGESLVELRMVLSSVHEEGANIGFFNGGEGADGGEFFNTDFTLAGFAQASSVEDFKGAAVKADFDAIDVARSSLTGANESLLFLT